MSLTIPRQITLLVIFFLFTGQIMLFSATAVFSQQRYGSEFYYLIRQGTCALLGMGLMLGISRVRYQIYLKLSYFFMFTLIGTLLLTLVTPLGHSALGASRWLKLGFVTFQPSEFTKIVLPIHLAFFCSSFQLESNSKKRLLGHGLLVLALLVCIYKQSDLGTTATALCLILSLLFIVGIRPLYLFGGTALGGAFVAAAMLFTDYRRKRLLAYLNPWSDPQGIGFQTIQSLISIHSGKLFGAGIGNGNSKLFYLPEVHTDFIFSLISEETGFIGAVVLILLFVYFSYLIFKVSFHAKDLFGRYLAFGLSFLILIQICINLGGVTGLIPVKGLPLPFISWGRSALIVNLAMVGILLNIARQSMIISEDDLSNRH